MLGSALGGSDTAAQSVFSGVVEAVRGLDLAAFDRVVAMLADVRARGARVYIVGNGGSAATGSHLACDLAKSTGDRAHERVRAVALSDAIPLLTAWGNDAGFEQVFASQLEVLLEPGDGVVAISVSGNSPNVVAALDTARYLGALTVGLFGADGGKARALVDVALVVPSRDYGVVESVHLAIAHAMTASLRAWGLAGAGSSLATRLVPRAASD